MSAVTPEDRDAMSRLLSIMEGETPPPITRPANSSYSSGPVELAGAGQLTQADVNAMADVLSKLNNVTQEVVTESASNPQLRQDVNTVRNDEGVKVGNYQIMIHEDATRVAGKQYYSIYNIRTNDVIASDLTLYETALSVVKLLNNGVYANNPTVRKLFEFDDYYTSHRTDAIRFKARMRKAEQQRDFAKLDMYESRYQTAVENAMNHKRNIKKIISESKAKNYR
jgi:hypothetical protein